MDRINEILSEKSKLRKRKKSYNEEAFKKITTTIKEDPNARKVLNPQQNQNNLLDLPPNNKRQRKLSFISNDNASLKALEEEEQLPENMITTPVIVIALCGGGCSGKTHLLEKILNHFKDEPVKISYLKEKNFYKDVEMNSKETEEFNYDHPDAINWELFVEKATELAKGKTVECPEYDIFENKRSAHLNKIGPCQILILEGLLLFHNPEIEKLCHLKVFLETDRDVMLTRKIIKDTLRGVPLDRVIDRYVKFIQPGYKNFVFPTKQKADLILDNFGPNDFGSKEGVFKQNRIVRLINTIIRRKFVKMSSKEIIVEIGEGGL